MNKDFPRIMTLLRKERGLSQKQAAADLDVTQALLSHYENGKRECGLDFLVRAADYYKVSVDYLLGRSPMSSGASISEQELPESTDGMVSVITDNARMFMPMAELVDLEKERARMEKELANAKKQLDGQNAKLANENFVSRAPEKVVNAEREKKAKLEALIENLEESLKNLG